MKIYKKYIKPLSLLFLVFYQTVKSQNLFNKKTILELKLEYNNKQVKKNTDKKSLVYSDLIFQQESNWDTIPIFLNARGNFRRANCYFPPLKLNIKKSFSNNTLFEGHKKLKIVLPCLLQCRANDDVLKEYLAYKIYELVSNEHFRTRLANIEYLDTRGEKAEIHPLAVFVPENLRKATIYEGEEAFAAKKPKTHFLKAILIEDDKVVAKRNNAKVLDRFVHPLNQAEIPSITNAFFQFMIGNTDFSTAYQHNQKLIFQAGRTIPLPYDFDMSGFVNSSYAVVSNIQNTTLDITDVKQRLYRGFKRDEELLQKVRQSFIEKESSILELFEEHQLLFEDKKTCIEAKKYIQSFFIILKNDTKFKQEIIAKSREK
ncbi:hypothetical protein CLV90_0548 [Maribacter spongiicola]|uniref:Uncharacterized protein n=1 Tax=Maribacter spongiicola TaxID=1206753 RepID=A0A4R7K5J2_9FLAO|nr:hypothetical protein [Maribacter spongiicola]TDT46497.1 hypothetical protein CLV90_0548 [Maribacter spongiicola]